jgi:hypothetical protein
MPRPRTGSTTQSSFGSTKKTSLTRYSLGVVQAIFEGHGVALGEPVEIVEDEPAVAATEKGRGEELRPFSIGLVGTDPR